MIKQQPFYIGQRVVAVCNGFNSTGFCIKKGDEFIVTGVKQCSCGMWKVDVGIKHSGRGSFCNNCHSGIEYSKIVWVNQSCLAPIDEGFKEIEYSKIIEKEKVCAS